MIFTQYYLDCLSHASYLVGDETTGRAVVVDPQRDVSAYLADAEAAGLRIELVVETHFHADFVSGHLELAARTGAEIAYGAAASAEYPIRRLDDGERLVLGRVVLEVLATPGHTPESISLVVYDGDTVYGVLTGDTLFVGDVGRPDLLASAGASPADMARQLYHSVHSRLLTLPETARVFPAHGAGSSCGKSLSTERSSTIGDQRRTNHALAPMSEDEFVARITDGQPTTPHYFAFDAHRNREARELLDESAPPPTLSVSEVLDRQRRGAALLDTRAPQDYAAGHFAGSINVGLGGRFAEFAGDVVAASTPIVLVCEPGTEMEGKVRLARIGFDNVVGALPGVETAFLADPSLVARSSRLTAAELAERLEAVDGLQLVDIRNPGEQEDGRIEGALSLPLAALLDRYEELDPDRPTVVYCAGGYRSSIAASLLASRGFTDVSDLLGGYPAWAERRPN
jgi:glyoxylase-like metal-dependent hydrolase (beta-lactamase superfamily II)/rhodanese-related sulfurtransferase